MRDGIGRITGTSRHADTLKGIRSAPAAGFRTVKLDVGRGRQVF